MNQQTTFPPSRNQCLQVAAEIGKHPLLQGVIMDPQAIEEIAHILYEEVLAAEEEGSDEEDATRKVTIREPATEGRTTDASSACHDPDVAAALSAKISAAADSSLSPDPGNA
jgi:hypothetical protein